MGTRSKPGKLDREALWEYALRSLGRRAQSASEVRQKLVLRAAVPSHVDEVMTRLQEYGFADDQKFAESFAAFRLGNQGFGAQRVMRDLRSKRVSERAAKEAVEKTFAGTDEAQLIDSFLSRKYRGKNLGELLRDPKNVNNVYRRLRMAGFSSAATLKALRGFTEVVEGVDESEDD